MFYRLMPAGWKFHIWMLKFYEKIGDTDVLSVNAFINVVQVLEIQNVRLVLFDTKLS